MAYMSYHEVWDIPCAYLPDMYSVYGSGESLPGADVLQAASSNSRVLYTLDVKSCIIAFDKLTLLLRAIGQLKSHA